MHSWQRWSIHGLPHHIDQPKQCEQQQQKQTFFNWMNTYIKSIEQINKSEINTNLYPEFIYTQYKQKELYIVDDVNSK